MECELTQDLVDACIPGDIVTVTGIIRVINNYMDIGGGKDGVTKDLQSSHSLTNGVAHESFSLFYIFSLSSFMLYI